MFFSHFSRRIAFLTLAFSLISTQALFADTLTKEATYYSDSFDGGSTSNGERFSQREHSAAICGMDLGQYLYVSKGGTGIVVKANDRPNCNRYPNVIDLSREAFRFLAPLGAGRLSDVSVTPIGWAPKSGKGFLPKDAFAHLGVLLDSSIPSVLFTGESIEIRGHVTDGKKNILVYISHAGDAISPVSFLAPVDAKGYFRSVLALPTLAADYTIVLASGNSFSTDRFSAITLIDSSHLSYPILSLAETRVIPLFQGGSSPYLSLPENTWAELSVTQDGKTFRTSGTALSLGSTSLRPGVADIELSGYTLSTPSSLDRSLRIASQKSRVILDRIHEDIGRANIRLKKSRKLATMSFITPTTPRLRSTYYITTPDGDVKEYTFPKEFVDTSDLLIPGKSIRVTFPFTTDGSYQIELVREDGIAYVNTSLTRGTVWSLLAPYTDEMMRTLRKNVSVVTQDTLKNINTLRMSQGRDMVSLDPELTRLAQMKAEDMANRGYAAHRDPDGNYIDGFARKRGFLLDTSLGENLAYGTISDIALQDGLEESGSHRYNMLRLEWQKVGIGYALANGKSYLVQVFSD